MGLPLLDVAPSRGWNWIRDGFATWRRRPLGFVALFAGFMVGVLLLMGLVPVVGGLLGLALVPMLTLGFMIGTRQALAGGPVTVLLLAEGLRTPDRGRRRSQLLLCAGYALGSVLVITLADWLDGGALDTLMQSMSRVDGGKPAADLEKALADPALLWGMVARMLLATALSVPFWYAPALVHWGGQSVGQALFSSTVAVWRSRGAFMVYALAWGGLLLAVVPLAALLVAVLGAPRLVGMLSLPMGLVLTAVFYVSLWFGYVDSFGTQEPAAPVP